MARIIFDEKGQFLRWIARFKGSDRMFMFITKEDKEVIFRPSVTTKGLDTAVFRMQGPDEAGEIINAFANSDRVFGVKKFIWKEDYTEPTVRED